MNSIGPAAFLFDADHSDAGTWYGGVFDPAFLSALKYADESKLTRSRILRGDLLISTLVYKTARVFIKGNTSGSEMVGDRNYFATLIGDLADSFKDQWNSLDLVEFPGFAMRNIHCIFVPTIATSVRGKLDSDLKQFPYYLGAVEIDMENPLHRRLFPEGLIGDAFVDGGIIYMEIGYEGEVDGIFEGANVFCEGGIHGLPSETYYEKRPAMELPAGVSPRGEISLQRLHKGKSTIYERVASDLSQTFVRDEKGESFEWDLRKLPNAPEDVEVQAKKLTEYLLNPLHSDGSSKAKFFDEVLDIRREDADFLRYQLIDGLREASFDEIRRDKHGIRFEAQLAIVGRNNRIGIVKTAWIIREGERASLVTAFPDRSPLGAEVSTPAPEVVPLGLSGAARWETIYAVASSAAAIACDQTVPTPMYLRGYEVIMDGQCGWAYVIVQDARRNFARWLLKTSKGHRHYHGGAAISAKIGDSQSYDKAVAYAEAFARVLRRNGVECKVESRLD